MYTEWFVRLLGIVAPDTARAEGPPWRYCVKRARVGFLVLPVLFLGCSSLTVNHDFDPDANFAAYKTYRWAAQDQAGGEQGGTSVSGLVAQRVRKAVDAEMEKEGLIDKKDSAKIDYVKVVDLDTLEDIDEIKDGALIALAVMVGKTRLIDNTRVGTHNE